MLVYATQNFIQEVLVKIKPVSEKQLFSETGWF